MLPTRVHRPSFPLDIYCYSKYRCPCRIHRIRARVLLIVLGADLRTRVYARRRPQAFFNPHRLEKSHDRALSPCFERV